MKNNKQKNICVALLRETKRKYYEDLGKVMLTTIKSFGKLSKRCLEIKSSAKVK